MSQPTCLLGLPCHGHVTMEMLFSILNPGTKLRILPMGHKSSDIDSNYSTLLANATNADPPFDYFALFHSDVTAEPGWLDKLYDEMTAVNADVISAVIPIKNEIGVTSTGLGRMDSRQVNRLTMKQVMDLSVTFSIEAFYPSLQKTKQPPLATPSLESRAQTTQKTWRSIAQASSGHYLAVNTGCMLWSRHTDWWKTFLREGGFHHEHGVEEDENGKFHPWFFAEDWRFSRWAARNNLNVYATRKMAVGHTGDMTFGNTKAWGEWWNDQDFKGY